MVVRGRIERVDGRLILRESVVSKDLRTGEETQILYDIDSLVGRFCGTNVEMVIKDMKEGAVSISIKRRGKAATSPPPPVKVDNVILRTRQSCLLK